jgi:hypothetical protein
MFCDVRARLPRSRLLCEFSLFSSLSGNYDPVLAYEAKSCPEMVERIRILNEAHHRVAGYLVYLLSNDEDTKWLKSVAAYGRRGVDCPLQPVSRRRARSDCISRLPSAIT